MICCSDISPAGVFWGHGAMKPYYISLKKKRRPHRRLCAILIGIATILVFYFVILGPIYGTGGAAGSQASFGCTVVLFFSLIVGFMLALCAWHFL
jgi:hypothetical protein